MSAALCLQAFEKLAASLNERADRADDPATIKALSASAFAAEEAAKTLKSQSQHNAVGQVETVEGVMRELDVAESLSVDNLVKPLNGRVIGRTKINVRDIQSGEIRFVMHEQGGDLLVELVFLDVLPEGDNP